MTDSGPTEWLEVETWDLNDRPVTTKFEGRWLVEPDEERTGADCRYEGVDGPAYAPEWYYGVAITKNDEIVVYVAHRKWGKAPVLSVFDDLDDARSVLPPSIVGYAEAALTGATELDL